MGRSVNFNRFGVEELGQAEDGDDVDFSIVKVRLDIHAIRLNRNDVVNKCGHRHAIHSSDELLTIVDHAHYLPAGVTIT